MPDLARARELWTSGRKAEAEAELVALLKVSPDDRAAREALAEIFGTTGRTSQSVEEWQRLAATSPDAARIHRQLAQALTAARRLPEAIESWRTALALDPNNSRAHNNLALMELRMGRANDAIASLNRVIAIDPGYAIAHMNLGIAYQALGRLAEARDSYSRAIALDPYLAQARSHLSALLISTDPAAATRERHRAIESQAINLMSARRHDEAVALWTQLIDDRSSLHYLPGMRFHCQLHGCDWSTYESTVRLLESGVLGGAPVDLPFSFFVYSDMPAAQRQCARIFTMDRHAGAAAPLVATPRVHGSSRSQRLRIAYLSFEFHEHPTAYLIAGVLEAHNRSRCEVSALSYGQPDDSAMRQRLRASVERFVDVNRMSDAEVVALMRSLDIDIAVDLKGHTGGARTSIFAQRPAPLQVSFLGYPGTMGADYMDYIIADEHVVPEQDRIYYDEQVIYMPGCYQSNDSQRPLPRAGGLTRADCGVPEQAFVFCCFNNLYKLTPAVFSVWLDLLQDIPHSVLWLLEGSPAAMARLHSLADARGIAAHRIVFAPHVSLAAHLGRYRHADLFLDTGPCNAHTTASDALWMGVPVVTVTGKAFASRVATSLLHAVGLPQLCMDSLGSYGAYARRLARAPAELAELKRHLEDHRHDFALFDSRSYCGHLETAYDEIWKRHLRGERPSVLLVPAQHHVRSL